MEISLLRIKSLLHKLQIDDPEYKSFRQNTTKWEVFGLRLPVMHALLRELPLLRQEEVSNLWLHSNVHEAMTIAILWFDQKKELTKQDWIMLKRWIDRVDNWEHSDALSSLYSRLFEKFPNSVLPTLKKWNRSRNPWKQRASIVSLIYYASPKRKAPPVSLVLKLVEPLIPSKDKYVNKAVGWTLRESHKLYPHETYTFIKKHVRDLSSDSFSYATEKITRTQKMELKKIRSRQKQKI